jgi:hypothetical protein
MHLDSSELSCLRYNIIEKIEKFKELERKVSSALWSLEQSMQLGLHQDDLELLRFHNSYQKYQESRGRGRGRGRDSVWVVVD